MKPPLRPNLFQTKKISHLPHRTSTASRLPRSYFSPQQLSHLLPDLPSEHRVTVRNIVIVSIPSSEKRIICLSLSSWRLSSAARRSEPAALVCAVAKARPSVSTRMVGHLVGTAQRECTNAIYLRRAWRIITVNLLLDLLVRGRVCLESEAFQLPATASL